MELRSFFWDAAAAHRGTSRRRDLPPGALRVGNAGDLLNIDLARHVYGADFTNIADQGRRLLLIGSVAHRILPGDVVCGVGTKGVDVPPAGEDRVRILGVRGPLTREAFRAAGHDVSGIRFEMDPGVLVPTLYAREVSRTSARRGRRIFIPHYRERTRFSSTRKLRVVDIDCTPRDLVRQILKAEHVYTSSLHGLVFAHALGRFATLTAPLTAEPEIKYRDYFASVGLDWRTPPDLDGALRERTPDSPFTVSMSVDDFRFPPAEELLTAGILTR